MPQDLCPFERKTRRKRKRWWWWWVRGLKRPVAYYLPPKKPI